jgi:hypothetical protein
MTAHLPHLEAIFPNLSARGYLPKSEKTPVYNCIAYAAGDETRRWEGFREGGYHWPDGAMEGHALDALISAFQVLGFAVCENGEREPDHEKIVLYVDNDGLWTHAAKQCDDGQWTSKLGSLEDIIHSTPEALTGTDPAYGSIACFMKRRQHP